MSAPATLWPLVLTAGIFVVIGAAILAWPRPLLRAYVRLVKPMRSLFGSIVDWEVRTLESRAAPWFVRLFGLLVILAGASIIAFPILGGRAG
jgi:hypothetical protein